MRNYQLSQIAQIYTEDGDLSSSERNLNQLTEDEIAELEAISEIENGGSAAGWASNALCFHYGICKPATNTEAPALLVDNRPDTNSEAFDAEEAKNSFVVVPNPTSDEAAIMAVDSNVDTESLSVFDVNGRRIFFQRGANHRRFDTSGLPNGVYFCRIVTLTGEVENIKFIVNH